MKDVHDVLCQKGKDVERLPPQGQRMSNDEMTSQQIQQSNELEQLSKPQPITVGGIESRTTFLRSLSPFPDANGQPQKERDWLVTVPRSDGGDLHDFCRTTIGLRPLPANL